MREVHFEQTSVSSFAVYEFGSDHGPSVAITAGVHGDEQTAIHAAFLLRKALGEQIVHGRVKLIPICNPAAYRNRSRRSPFDHLDMNRIFPGSAQGSPSMQLADALWRETRDAQYIIDLHCCGMGGSTYTLAQYEQYPDLRELAEALGIPIVIQSGGTSGQLFVESCKTGQKALIIELPGGQPGGTIDVTAAEQCCKTIIGYLCYLGILEKKPQLLPVIFYGKITDISAPHPGLFMPVATPGSESREGECLGTFDGVPVTAPFDGVITTVSPARYCFAGERMAGVASLKKGD
jgi:predicted deacylase